MTILFVIMISLYYTVFYNKIDARPYLIAFTSSLLTIWFGRSYIIDDKINLLKVLLAVSNPSNNKLL